MPLRPIVWTKKDDEHWRATLGDIEVAYLALTRDYPLLGKWQAETRRPFDDGVWVSRHPTFDEAQESANSRVLESVVPFLALEQAAQDIIGPTVKRWSLKAAERACHCGNYPAAREAERLAVLIDEKRVTGRIILSEKDACSIQVALEDAVGAHHLACACWEEHRKANPDTETSNV